MRAGIAAGHGGFVVKEQIADLLRGAAHDVVDVKALEMQPIGL